MFKTIAKVLSENGHKVFVITNDIMGETYEESDSLKIIRVKPTMKYAGGIPPTFLDNIRYLANAFFAGYKTIRKEKIDIIHSNNFAPAMAGAMLSIVTRIPHITAVHDLFSIYEKDFWKKWSSQSGVSRTNARLVPFFEKMMIRLRSECIHTVSDATKNDIVKLGTKKPIHVIPNCILDRESIQTKAIPEQFAAMGRLVFYKNIQILIRAAAIVSKEFPRFRLVIAGDGPYRDTLERLGKDMNIEHNIEFRGHVTAEEKENILAQSNALLFPSKIEGFGLVILESFQQKRPVIALDIPPMSEIIQDGKNGILVKTDDEKLWAEKIQYMINDQTVSYNMGNCGYETLQKKYNTKTFYENILKMYKSVLEN